MTTRDSNFETQDRQPGSLMFWVAASGAVAVVALSLMALFAPRSPGPDSTLVIDLRSVTPTTKTEAKSAATSPEKAPVIEEAQALPVLTASNGAIVVDPALQEITADGPMPIVAKDGRRPMDVYAAPFDKADQRPRIAIFITGLGLSDTVTQAAIDRLPPGTTLALTPYGEDLQTWVAAARSKGHEVVLEVPMEPFDYPQNDPGPSTLLTGPAAAENAQRARWLLTRVSGYAGVINVQGAKFMASPDDLKKFVTDMASRGLYVLDTGQSQRSLAPAIAKEGGAAFARADVQIDQIASPDAINAALDALANMAVERRYAIGHVTASPGAIDQIVAWSQTLQTKGIAWGPASAVVPLYINRAPKNE